MPKYCFRLTVQPDLLGEYKRRHRQVWPEMLDALQTNGWHDYSLYADESGLVIGTVVSDDFEALVERTSEEPANGRWQAEMRRFFVGLGDSQPDRGVLMLDEIFNLDDQVRAAGGRL